MPRYAHHAIAISLALAALVSQPIHASSPVNARAHWRYSPNGKFVIWYDPDSSTQRVCDSGTKALLWTFSCTGAWPPGDTDEDGCLFLANDGQAAAALLFPFRRTAPSSRQLGLGFYFADGKSIEHDLEKRAEGLVLWLHALPCTLLKSIGINSYRGNNHSFNGEVITVTGPGLFTETYKIADGRKIFTTLNVQYLLACFVVYVVPLLLLIHWFKQRHNKSDSEHKLLKRKDLLAPYLCFGIVTAFVWINFLGTLGLDGSLHDLFRGTQRIAISIAYTLLPLAFVASAVVMFIRFRKIEVAAIWFAVLAMQVFGVHSVRNFPTSRGSESAAAAIILALFSIPFIVRFTAIWFRYRKQRRRVRSGCCFACGYDLRESEAICPECGTGIVTVQAEV